MRKVVVVRIASYNRQKQTVLMQCYDRVSASMCNWLGILKAVCTHHSDSVYLWSVTPWPSGKTFGFRSIGQEFESRVGGTFIFQLIVRPLLDPVC